MLEFKNLAAFQILAECLHFGQAAKRLKISQPSLSVRLKRLEQQVGFPLFHRSPARVELTESGKFLLPYVQNLLSSLDATEAAAVDIKQGNFGSARIGMTPIALFTHLPDVLRQVAADDGNTEFELFDDVSNGLEAGVQNRMLDLAVVHPPLSQSDLSHAVMFASPFVAVLPPSHPCANQTSIELADLRTDPFVLVDRAVGPNIYDRLIGACVAAGYSPNIRQHVRTSLSMIGCVAAGMGVGLTVSAMQSFNRDGVVFLPVRDLDLTLEYALCWRPGPFEALARRIIQRASQNTET